MIIDVLRQACRIDIFDLNYFASNEACGYLNCNPQILPRKGYLKRIAAFIVHFLQETKTSLFVRKVPPGAALFFVVSKNQKDSLSGVAAITDRSVTAGDKFDPQFHFPLFWAYLVSVFFLPCLIVRYCQGGDYQKKAFSYLIDTYLLTYGYYVVGAFWLRRARPNCLVVANDHVMQTRIMTLLAQKMGVPTVYIQHASVTEKFPPLIFDFALLEGVDALRKYEKKGATSTQVFLVGMPKADAFAAAVNGKAVVSRVGICCNLFDGEDEVKTLCAQLVQRFPTVKFTLRPHPGDNRRFGFWKQMTANLEMGYSDPLAGGALDFLGTVDAIIAGESNIHLEAALLDVYPLYFSYSSETVDWYGFRRNGVIEYFPDADALCAKIAELLVEKPSVRERCKPYCHTVGTVWDWKSSLLTKAVIEGIAGGDPFQRASWQPYRETGLKVFEPR